MMPSSTLPLLMTASHCIPRDEHGELLPLYVGVDQCLQLDPPLVSEYVANPYDGIDFALFDAQEAVDAAAGSKEAFIISEWPVPDPTIGEEVVVIGYARERMETEAETMSVRMKLDAYAGGVTSTARYVFRAGVGVMPPYTGALPIDDAVGLSGSPCFRVERINELCSNLFFCGIHRAAGAGAIIEQRLSVIDALVTDRIAGVDPAR